MNDRLANCSAQKFDEARSWRGFERLIREKNYEKVWDRFAPECSIEPQRLPSDKQIEVTDQVDFEARDGIGILRAEDA